MLHRPLVAADPHVDPHRLVGFCCQHAGDEPLGVCLLIVVEDEARPWSESTAQAERLLHDADLLLGAAAIQLEEVVITDGAGSELAELVRFGGFDALLVCSRDDAEPTGVLRLAARLASAMFAFSALLLAGIALRIDRAFGPLALAAAVVLLATLLAAYVATRFVALPPVPHAEPVDLLGAATKLIEAGGLVLALRLLGTRAGGEALPALYEGAGR